MKYMIHSCDKRLWYVKEFLIPSMLKQGIPEGDIAIYNDDKRIGCLWAYYESFKRLPTRGGTWHLQDDVLISRDFAEKTRKHNKGIVYGFFHRHKSEDDMIPGMAPASKVGYSFPCLRIPNREALDFAEWIITDARHREKYREWFEQGKCGDALWMEYLKEKYRDDRVVYNLKPSIVEHVDVMIGGPVVNWARDYWCRATYWDDEEAVMRLKKQLAQR